MPKFNTLNITILYYRKNKTRNVYNNAVLFVRGLGGTARISISQPENNYFLVTWMVTLGR